MAGLEKAPTPRHVRRLIAGLSLTVGAVLGFGLYDGDRVPLLQPLMPSFARCNGDSDQRVLELARLAQRQGLPGVQIAYVDGAGRLVSCASGWARFVPIPELMRTDHRLRYASLSKLLTVALALRLVAAGQIGLGDRLVDRLDFRAKLTDKRIAQITLSQLMNHTAGFDRAISGDPMTERVPWYPSHLATLGAIKLDTAPGAHFSYSNLGYCLLGAALAKTGGHPLEELLKDDVLRPLDASEVKLADQRRFMADEPKYFFNGNESAADLLGFNCAANIATGAWTGTARTLAVWLHQAYGPESTLLSQRLLAAALAGPAGCDTGLWRTCHALGFYRYQEAGRRPMFWRDGSLPGLTGFAALFGNGETLVLLANARTDDWQRTSDLLGQAIYRLFAQNPADALDDGPRT
jgi:CubicO group peptidase (beta-lactamase class C family)